jgi:methyl-accepting chemotaxis protein
MNMNEKEDKYLILQKKLLALNASFEAARAGEVGSDFFMVVDKISGLAMQWGETTGHNNKKGDG